MKRKHVKSTKPPELDGRHPLWSVTNHNWHFSNSQLIEQMPSCPTIGKVIMMHRNAMWFVTPLLYIFQFEK